MPSELETPSKEAADFFKDLDKDLGSIHTKVVDENNEEDEEKKKKEEADKQKNNIIDDSSPKFERKQKEKPTKEDSIAALRKDRDNFREANKQFTEIFGDHDPKAIKPILDYIVEQADGPITADFVTEKVNELRSLHDKAKTLEEEVKLREQKVQELDIRESTEFEEGFKKPYTNAYQELFLEFAQLGADKKVIGPAASKKLQDFLTSGEEIDGLSVKAALTEFAKSFKNETGEDPVLPSVSDLMKARRNFVDKRTKMADAYKNWKQTKEEQAKKKEAEKEIQTEAQIKAAKRARTDAASKAFREFDLDSIPFVEEKDLESLFKEEFTFVEGIHEGKEIPPYETIISRGVKARLWDKHYKELVELRQFKEDFEEGERNSKPGSRRAPLRQSGKEIDWLTGKPKE